MELDEDEKSKLSEEKNSRDRRVTMAINVLAGIATVAALLFSIFIYYSDKKSRELKVVLIDSSAFLQNKVDFGRNVTVNVEGKVVDQLWYIKIRYENSGRSPIKKEDIESSTKINFDKAKIISTSVSERNPTDVKIDVRNFDSFLELSHGLMNPGDYIVMDVLVTGSSTPTISCSYRITEIASCLFQDKSTLSKEIYLVGIKVSDNTALIFASIATIFIGFLLGFFAWVISQALVKLSNFVISRYRTHSLEGAIERIYGKPALEKLVSTKLKDVSTVYARDENIARAKKFADDADGLESIGELIDKTRQQAVQRAVAVAVENVIIGSLNKETNKYFSIRTLNASGATAFVNFEDDAISYLLWENSGTDLTDLKFAVPLFCFSLITLFVCAGPLRTLVERSF